MIPKTVICIIVGWCSHNTVLRKRRRRRTITFASGRQCETIYECKEGMSAPISDTTVTLCPQHGEQRPRMDNDTLCNCSGGMLSCGILSAESRQYASCFCWCSTSSEHMENVVVVAAMQSTTRLHSSLFANVSSIIEFSISVKEAPNGMI